MANVRLPNVSNQAVCDALVDLIDVGGAGTIQIRSGTQPADADDAATGTLLATLTFNATAFGAADAAGTATANTITADTSADATGTAAWARILNGSSGTIFDCDVGEAADSATITLNSKSITAGVEVQMTAFTVTHPDGT